MSTRSVKLKGFEWIDIINPSDKEVHKIIENNGFHILDEEAILEENQRARVDVYDDYLFVVLHFPKYSADSKRYVANEFNVFLTKKNLITIRFSQSSSVDKVFSRYRDDTEHLDQLEVSSAYALYDLIEAMLDRVMNRLDTLSRDIRFLEKNMFDSVGEHTIQDIMIKKRNTISLKHMVKPQVQVLKALEVYTNEIFKEQYEVYFENLQDKLEKINAEISLIQENLDSMEDTLKSIFDMQMNNSIRYLTIFSAFMLPLTFITGFFGMNAVSTPFPDWIIWLSLMATIGIMVGGVWYLIKKGRI